MSETQRKQRCGYGCCDLPDGHDHAHRCRCGGLVVIPNARCAWHSVPPRPMSTRVLAMYLEAAADEFYIEDKEVMVNGTNVVNARVFNGNVILETWDDYLERHRYEN